LQLTYEVNDVESRIEEQVGNVFWKRAHINLE